MSKGKKEKKDFELRLYDMFEDEIRLTHSYIAECLEEIKPRYTSSVNDDNEKIDHESIEDARNNEQLWQFLDNIESGNNADLQKKNKSSLEKLLLNHKTDNAISNLLHSLGKSDLRVQFHPFLQIDFSQRSYDHNLLAGDFGHAVGYFKFSGDDSIHWFESLGNKTMDAEVIASISGDTETPPCDPECYLKVLTDTLGEIIYELEEFRLFAYEDDYEQSKFGLFTVFNKKLRILYADTVFGNPNLDTAVVRPINAVSNVFVPHQSLRYFK